MPVDPVAAHLNWLRLSGRRETTIYERKRALARMRAALPVPLLDADEDHLAAWRASLAGLSDYAIATYVGHAQGFYGFAVKEGLINANPAARLPVPQRPRRLPRPIAEDDLLTALASAPPRVRPWLILAAYCGLRAREIAYLMREDVLDHAQPPVLLVTERAGKGGRERMVPLPGIVLAEVVPALPSHGYAFPRGDGQSGRPNQPWMISRLACESLHDAGIPATLHCLRHRYASALYKKTHDLRLVQELLGHENISTTSGYAAYDKTTAITAVNELPVPPPRKRGRPDAAVESLPCPGDDG